MKFRRYWLLLAITLWVAGSMRVVKANNSTSSFLQDSAYQQTQNTYRVNVPYDVPGHEAAVFWFGRVTPDDNYVDVRIGYSDEYLFLHFLVFDRLLWYDRNPSPNDLINWDSVTVYLNTAGPVGSLTDTSYRFDAQLNWWGDRENYQASYHWRNDTWVSTTDVFTTTSSWNGNAPNDTEVDRGWMVLYKIPYSALGLDGPPTESSVWGLGVALHDRDNPDQPPLADQVWPELMSKDRPETWGELTFGGLPDYEPMPATPENSVRIRNGLANFVVEDADVGGSSTCGDEAAPDYFPEWGELNYAGKEFLNVQNLGYASEWPCFSKYYVTFPLDSIPSGKVILSATLTLYQFGNAGQRADPGPQPSLIQVHSVDRDWDESSITWNNAPMSTENIAESWIDPLDEKPDWPGVPRSWDVSYAVSKAYLTDESLRLAVYSPAWEFHSGKYFYTSDIGASGEGRPTLNVTWGAPLNGIQKQAMQLTGDFGETLTYTLSYQGTGALLSLTDTLPDELAWTDNVLWQGTVSEPIYEPDNHTLTWSGRPSQGQQVIITYTTCVDTQQFGSVVNTVELVESGMILDTDTSTTMVNPARIWLPLVLGGR
jgi:hypothetical protein